MRFLYAGRLMRAEVFCLAAVLSFTADIAIAQESWMTQRQAAAASQQNLERLADQARQRNSPSRQSSFVAPTPEEVRAAEQKAQNEQALENARYQRELGERAAIQTQRQIELDKRYREVDAWAAAAKQRGYQEIDARAAREPAMRALLKAGPTPSSLSAYCDAVNDFTTNRFVADPVLAVRSIEKALRLDETHPTCWKRYSELLSLYRTGEEPLRYFKLADYSPLGFIPRDHAQAGAIISARFHALRAANDRRRNAVATYLDPARRLAAFQMPEQLSNWRLLSSMHTPEARYWQARVHRLGLLGQPVNPQLSLEASCSKEGESFYRNRLNCMIESTPPGTWSSANLAAFKVLVDTVTEPRNPQNFLGPEQRALLAEINTRRADRAIGLAVYAGLAFKRSTTGPGTIGSSPEIKDADRVAMHYREEGCNALEEAVSLGHYDSGPDVVNLLKCYDLGYIHAPTGARDRVVAVLESENNAVMKTYILDPSQ